MIDRETIANLKHAFIAGQSSRMAAVDAGCSVDTARRYRRALEAVSAIPATPVRRVKDGRLVHVENIGAHMRTSGVPPTADRRRIALALAA